MTDDKAEQPKKQMEWVQSPNGVLEVYANTSHIVWSLDDIRIRLGQIINSPQTPSPGPALVAVTEERAAVTFTWRNAVLLRDQLSALVEAYEKANGPIKKDVKLVPAPF